MKLLLLIPALGPIYGGTTKIIFELASALGRRGLAVDVVATNANGPADLEVPCGKWIEKDSCRLRYFPRWGRREFKFSPALFSWLWQHARDYDFVHLSSDFNFPVLAGAMACRRKRTPYMVTPQGMLEPWALKYKAYKKQRYFRWIERPLVLRRASLVQALNGSEAANIAQLALGPPVVLLPNGINAEEAATDLAAEEREVFFNRFPEVRGRRVILFLHRVDPKKGLDVLANAYAEVRRQLPDTHLLIAGPPTAGFEATARGYFEAAGVADTVTFTGMLEGIWKRRAWQVASVFVAPSYSEGFSMSVLEAMAAGLACVLTEGCNFPEAGAAGAARIVPAGDAGRFAAELLDLLKRPDAAREVGIRARELVLSRYTWTKIAEEYERAVRQILGV